MTVCVSARRATPVRRRGRYSRAHFSGRRWMGGHEPFGLSLPRCFTGADLCCRNRSSCSDRPPQIPKTCPVRTANDRHWSTAGQLAQIALARPTRRARAQAPSASAPKNGHSPIPWQATGGQDWSALSGTAGRRSPDRVLPRPARGGGFWPAARRWPPLSPRRAWPGCLPSGSPLLFCPDKTAGCRAAARLAGPLGGRSCETGTASPTSATASAGLLHTGTSTARREGERRPQPTAQFEISALPTRRLYRASLHEMH